MLEDLPLVLKTCVSSWNDQFYSGYKQLELISYSLFIVYTQIPYQWEFLASEFNENEINSVIIYSHVVPNACFFSSMECKRRNFEEMYTIFYKKYCMCEK